MRKIFLFALTLTCNMHAMLRQRILTVKCHASERILYGPGAYRTVTVPRDIATLNRAETCSAISQLNNELERLMADMAPDFCTIGEIVTLVNILKRHQSRQ